MSIFKGQQTISTHGTKQGITPRFWIQTMELATSVFGKDDGDKLVSKFFPENLGDFTNLYDIFHEIKNDYSDFKGGLKDGRYFSINEKGDFRLDTSVELRMEKKVKDFFILGRLLINNFSKSQILNFEHFDLNKFIIVKDSNFKKNSEEYYINDSSGKFKLLIDLIDEGRNKFLTDFNQIRADIEHNNFRVPKFNVNTDNGDFVEPSMNGQQTLIEELSFFYHNLLELLENMIAYFFANIVIAKNPNQGLFIRTDFDYTKTISKYVIFPKMMRGMQNLKLVI